MGIFLPELKQNIKKSFFWKSFTRSVLYHRIRFPESYRLYRKELLFYRNILKLQEKKPRLIFDVGANMGRKSFIFSKLVDRVIAFEPGPRLYQFLEKRFPTSNVVLINCALGEKSSFEDLYLIEQNQAYNSLSKKHIDTTVALRGVSKNVALEKVKVKVEPLESFIKRFGIPDYLKIDVEGYEYQVLRGLHTPVPILSFEVNLPEFRSEAILAVEYLNKLSKGKYSFNYCVHDDFENKNFTSPEVMIEMLLSTSLTYLEIFAKLDSSEVS